MSVRTVQARRRRRRAVRAAANWIGGRFDALIRAGEIGTALKFPRRR